MNLSPLLRGEAAQCPTRSVAAHRLQLDGLTVDSYAIALDPGFSPRLRMPFGGQFAHYIVTANEGH
jgi:hypothetical protein